MSITTTGKTLCIGVIAAAASTVGATTATAAGPELTDRYSIEIDETDEFLTALCGFQIDVDGTVEGVFRAYADGRIHVNERGTIVLSNAETGRTLTNDFQFNLRGRGSETVDGSTLIVRFTDVFAGVPERWTADDGTVLIMDRGRAVIEGEVVIDLETGDVVSESVEFVTNGPHPILENGLDPAQACGLLA